MRLIVLIWFLLLTGLSLAPLELKVQLGTKGQFHNIGHFFMFVATALLLSSIAKSYSRKLLYCAGGWCFAVFSEVLEAGIYHNRFEWLDLWTDTLGLAIGLATVTILALAMQRRDAAGAD